LAARERYRTLRDSLAAHDDAVRSDRDFYQVNAAAETQEIWALKDVSFQVNAGEVVALLGAMARGSTLLKILSRITEPTRRAGGVARAHRELLEVGTGFHPE